MSVILDAQVWIGLSAPACAVIAARTAYAFGADADASVSPHVGMTALWALASGLCALTAPSAEEALADVILLTGLIHLALIDWRLMVVPVRFCLLLALIGVAWTLLVWGGVEAGLHSASALLGWGSLRGLDRFYWLLRGRVGLGEGDALIAAVLGSWLGLEGLAWSVAIGGGATIFAIWMKRAMSDPFPFAPGLALGALVVLWVKQIG